MMLQFYHSAGILPERPGQVRTLTFIHDGKAVWMKWLA